ncbi:uncharacterized protein ASPGLDRAFT_40424 [Aspergillus glaucus CBS 516.65]|uniref:Glycosyl hydrolase family 32 N-terminal domain-containing protein n=1 Tax=Aspergillus glaucus CBS 516.65 TaxID=1160497 RepID=A0A1L9V4F8_ASPGL|nr:hypothetical protein ASPGLDRAFT_40424 [Aspergillus glaucus CBS 516.65]OJJ78815.1 hypothetical protein ASPGLDRAFT_40424 [Aspergillus glaucus CBS 516.65]
MHLGLFALPLLAATAQAAVNYSEPLRPQVQFSPPEGFMNDPNGLFYDAKRSTYHYYYQYNPDEPVAGNQHWGHATSPDLYHWTNHPLALEPDNADTFIFSGSAIIDSENTSGFFPDQDDGVVAIYTAHSSTKETQHIAYSTDGGYTFTKYANNPVIDSHTNQFRDPKVFWHAESQKWAMVIAWAEDLKIGVFTSPNLKDWTATSNFTQEGLPGDQFECPNLVKFSVDEETTKDVLFISVNPGAPLGGSGTYYVVGDFNGTHFNSETEDYTLIDFSKDNYAAQWFDSLPEDSKPVSIGWASNWDYTEEVPSAREGWRSAATVPREHTLTKIDGAWRVTQTPFQGLSSVKGNKLEEKTFSDGDISVDFSSVESNAVYFDVAINNLPSADATGELTFNFTSSASGDYLDGAVELNTGSFWINRAGTHLFTTADNGNFTGQFDTSISVSESGQFTFSGVIDRSVFEVFLEDGKQSGVMSFFPTKPLDTVTFAATGLGEDVTVDVGVWGLKSGWSS